jgi:molybdate transport system ATP-binding protein
MSGDPLVIFNNAAVARSAGPAILHNVSWTIREGETWAIVGPMGSGKSTLVEAVLGKHRIAEGEVSWPLLESLRQAGHHIAYPAEVMRLVSFKEESRLFSYADHYYQQRFEFADADDPLTLDSFLRKGSDASENEIATIAERLGLADLRSLSFIKLSNGQVRRARIARALLGHPELLVLDDPFIGLDTAGRGELDRLLGELIGHGQRLLLVVREDAIPMWVTHVLKVDDGTASEIVRGDRREPTRKEAPFGRREQSNSEPIIELNRVSVVQGGKTILADISWTVRAGERWALVGSNGAGKTTLLSLVCGDHPQAYANDVRLFGQRRGTGESIWDVKRRIGLVSPEFHLYFHGPLNAFEVAVTGFHDILAYRKATPEQTAAIRELFIALELSHLAERPFARLSTGEQRLILIARALVKRPPLLVLDEPFQGFDSATVGRIRDWLDRNLQPDQTLIFVSHQPQEIPGTVTRRLELEGGRVTAIA